MKHIVLPVNFSLEVRNSLIAFINQILEKTQDVQFTLLHAYDTTGYGAASLHDISDRLEKNAMQDLMYEKRKIEEVVPQAQLNTYVGRGILSSVVNNYEKTTKIDFMVLPLKGSNMLQSILMSSKPSQLAEKSNVPMLFLPDAAHVKLPREIAFGTDVKPFQNVEDFAGLLNICHILDAKLHFVYVSEDGVDKRDDFEKYYVSQLKDFKYDYTKVVEKNAAKGLLEFIKKQKLDGIALIERKGNFLKHLFSQSVLDEMLELAKLPVMVINELREAE